MPVLHVLIHESGTSHFLYLKVFIRITRRQESKWQDSANNLWIQTDCRSSRCLIAPNLPEWILMWLNAPLVAAPSYHGPSGSMIMNGIGEHKRIWCKKQHSFFCGSLKIKRAPIFVGKRGERRMRTMRPHRKYNRFSCYQPKGLRAVSSGGRATGWSPVRVGSNPAQPIV